MEFDIFLSFSSRDRYVFVGGKKVDAVHEVKNALETHWHSARAWFAGRRRLKVCTYDEDFELDDTVLDSIRQKLSKSRRLLVLCSTKISGSKYVKAELEINAHLGKPSPLAARLSANPELAFPSYFSQGTLAADLTVTPGLSLKEWRAKVQMEAHKIVAKVWSVPLNEVQNRFRHDRQLRRVQAATALVLILGSAGWGGWQFYDQREQHELRSAHLAALNALRDVGFNIEEIPNNPQAVRVAFRPASGQGILYRGVPGLDQLERIIGLRELDLSGSPVSDESLDLLKGLPELRWLDISETNVTDRGVPILAELQLDSLFLGPGITDKGLSALAQSKLIHLEIEGAQITDRGIRGLEILTLETLVLANTKVSSSAIERIQAARPNVTIRTHDERQVSLNKRLRTGGYVGQSTDSDLDKHLAAESLNQLLDVYRGAIVSIRDSGPSGYLHTGFFISPVGHILTAAFSLQGRARVHTASGHYGVSSVLHELAPLPVMVLKIDVRGVPFLELDGSSPELGGWVASLGSSSGVEQIKAVPGIIVALDILRQPRNERGVISGTPYHVFQHSREERLAGFEGGPVVAIDGRVVGLHLEGYDKGMGEQWSLSVRAELIRRTLQPLDRERAIFRWWEQQPEGR